MQNATFNSTVLGVNGLLSGGTASLALPGWVLGGQIGFNWQVSPLFVLGAEADWQWTSQKGRTNSSTPPADLAFFGAGANGFGYSLATQQKLTDVATARVRGGFLVHDTLWYVTGGLAWGTIKDSYTFTGTANPADLSRLAAARSVPAHRGKFLVQQDRLDRRRGRRDQAWRRLVGEG